MNNNHWELVAEYRLYIEEAAKQLHAGGESRRRMLDFLGGKMMEHFNDAETGAPLFISFLIALGDYHSEASRDFRVHIAPRLDHAVGDQVLAAIRSEVALVKHHRIRHG